MLRNEHSHINRFLFFFISKLRLSSPWKFKAPILISSPYFIFLLSNYIDLNAFLYVVVSLVIIIGVAGIGYLSNDLGDREKDKLINKSNSTVHLSNSNIVMLMLLFFCLVLLPWYYLEFDICSILLFILQLLLFYAYAFRPFRLKERGFFGVITDALYAHVLPAILASYTFCLTTKFEVDKYIPFVVLLSMWQLFLGMRNIIFHQLMDYDNDLASNTHTFVTKFGRNKTEVLVTSIFLPFEIVFFLIFVIYISCFYKLFLILISLYWLYKVYQEKQNLKDFKYRDFAYKFLDDLYIQWIPLSLLIILSINSINYIPILVLHFILFRSEFKTFLLNKFS